MSVVYSKSAHHQAIPMLDRYYQQVLGCLIDHLYKYNKYRPRGMDEEHLDHFEKKVKGLLRDPKRLFCSSNRYKEGSQWSNDIFALVGARDVEDIKAEMRMQQHEAKKLAKVSGARPECVEEILAEDPTYVCVGQSAQGFHPNAENKEEHIDQIRKQNSQQEEDGESSISFKEQQFRPIDYLKYLGFRIVGRYQADEFKYSWKQDKYQMHLQDVFLKSMDGEQYFPSLSLEMKGFDKTLLKEFHQ